MTAAPVSSVDRSAVVSAAPAPLKRPVASTSYLVFLPPPKQSKSLLRDRSINNGSRDGQAGGSDAKWKRGRSRYLRRGGEEGQWVEADRANISRSSSSIHHRAAPHASREAVSVTLPEVRAPAAAPPARSQGNKGDSENVREEILAPATQSGHSNEGGTRFKPRYTESAQKRDRSFKGGRTRSAQDPLTGSHSGSSGKSHSTSSDSSLELTPAGEAALRLRNLRTTNPQLAAVPLVEVSRNLSHLISPGLGRGTASGNHYSSRLDDGISWTETLVTGLAEREQELTRDISNTHLGTMIRSGLGGRTVRSASGSVVVSPATRADDSDETRRYRLDEEERAFLAGPFSLGSTSIGLALKCQAGEEPLRHADEGFSGGSQENVSISRALRSESEVRALEMERERVRREREEDEDGLSVWPTGKDKRGKVRFVSAREAMQDSPKEKATSAQDNTKKRGLKRGPTQGVAGSQESPESQKRQASNASQTEEEEEEIPLTPVRRKRRKLEPPTPLPTPSERPNQLSGVASEAHAQLICHCQCQSSRVARGVEAQSRPALAMSSRADEVATHRSGPASAEESRSVTSPIKRARSDPKPISSTPLLAPLAPLPSSSDPSPRTRLQTSASTSGLTSLPRANQSVCRFSIFSRGSADASTSASASRSRVLRTEEDGDVLKPTVPPARQARGQDITADASRTVDTSISHHSRRQGTEARHNGDSTISRSDFVPPTMREERDDLPPQAPLVVLPGARPILSKAPAEAKAAEPSATMAVSSTKEPPPPPAPVAKTASKSAVLVSAASIVGQLPSHKVTTTSKPSATVPSSTSIPDPSTTSSERPTTSRPQRPPPVPIPPLRASTCTKSHGPSKLAQSLTAESLDRSLNMAESCESVGQSSSAHGQTMTMTGLDSIPPPPSLHFDPRDVTSLLSILRNPTPHLPAKHGGHAEQITSPRINVLVLIRQVGALEEIGVKVFSKGKVVEGRVDMMARSELVVMDGDGGISRVVLWGQCALEWAGLEESRDAEEEEEEVETSGEHSLSTRAGMTTTMTMDTTNFRGDETTTYGGVLLRNPAQQKPGSKAPAAKAKPDRRPVGPLRPGDVVCLSSLIVSPIPVKPSDPPQRAVVTRAQPASVQLVASERTASKAELCWRWDLHGRERERERARRKYRFDVALADFDRRCKEVWKCAARWDGAKD